MTVYELYQPFRLCAPLVCLVLWLTYTKARNGWSRAYNPVSSCNNHRTDHNFLVSSVTSFYYDRLGLKEFIQITYGFVAPDVSDTSCKYFRLTRETSCSPHSLYFRSIQWELLIAVPHKQFLFLSAFFRN